MTEKLLTGTLSLNTTKGWGSGQIFVNKWMPIVTQNPIQSSVDQQPDYRKVPILEALLWGGVGEGGRYLLTSGCLLSYRTSWPARLQRGPYIVSWLEKMKVYVSDRQTVEPQTSMGLYLVSFVFCMRCFHYFQKAWSTSHNFSVVKNFKKL